MTSIEYTIYEQPQPPELDCPVLENPTADNPILENPTTDNPTSENPTQLNKDISRTNLPKKEKSNTDLSITHSIPIHSLNPLHCGECMDVFTGGKWKPTRIEYGDNWYLVGIRAEDLNGLRVRI